MATTFGTAGAIRAVPLTAGHYGQGVSYPLEVDVAGRLSLSFGPALVAEALESILQTQPGERPMCPDYGTSMALFEPVNQLDAARLSILENIEAYEPRISPSSVSVDMDNGSPVGTVDTTIRYALKGEADERTLTAGLFVGPALQTTGT